MNQTDGARWEMMMIWDCFDHRDFEVDFAPLDGQAILKGFIELLSL